MSQLRRRTCHSWGKLARAPPTPSAALTFQQSDNHLQSCCPREGPVLWARWAELFWKGLLPFPSDFTP